MSVLPNIDTLKAVSREMNASEKRKYEPQYIDEEDVLAHHAYDFCDTCPEIVEERDIDCAICPCDFDSTDVDCVYSYKYDSIKEVIIFADMVLRAELGDYWRDNYSKMLGSVCVWAS